MLYLILYGVVLNLYRPFPLHGGSFKTVSENQLRVSASQNRKISVLQGETSMLRTVVANAWLLGGVTRYTIVGQEEFLASRSGLQEKTCKKRHMVRDTTCDRGKNSSHGWSHVVLHQRWMFARNKRSKPFVSCFSAIEHAYVYIYTYSFI